MANGKIIYTPIGGTLTTYTFALNPSWDYEDGYVEGLMDAERTLDGTLNTYAGAVKKKASLSFEHVSAAQLASLQAAWEAQVEVDYYFDSGGSKTFTGVIMTPPAAKAQAAFVGGAYTWNLTLELEEV